MTPAVILAALLRLAPWHQDHDAPEARRALLEPIAAAIAATARSREEAAALVAVGWSETKFARAVLEGHCDRMPAGSRCDHGRARGPWQVHAWCRDAWALPDGSPEAYTPAARCVLRALRGGLQRCSSWHGAMAALLGGGGCRDFARADAYEQTMRTVLGWWSP